MDMNRRGFLGAGAVMAAAGIAGAWRAEYPDRPVPKYMEAYEVSEYGRAPTEADLQLLVGEA